MMSARGSTTAEIARVVFGAARLSRPNPSSLPAVLVTLMLVAAACSSSNPTNDPAPEPDPPSNTQPDAEPDAPEPPQPVESDNGAATEADLADIWTAFHAAWIEQAALDDPDPNVFDGLALEPDEAVATLVAQRGEARIVTTDAELWPRLDITDQAAQIADCAIVTQHPEDQQDSAATVTVRWEATATVTADGWRIETALPVGLFCVAEELNEQLLGAYRDFRSAKDAAWDPPDPAHPDLERTMAGRQLEFIRELLADHQRDGIVIRDPAPTDNAVVFDVGIGTATVSDCAEQVPERGAYDLETGERLDELIPPVRDGQLDGQSVELERQSDGAWRVVAQAGTRDTDCIPGSTNYAVS